MVKKTTTKIIIFSLIAVFLLGFVKFNKVSDPSDPSDPIEPNSRSVVQTFETIDSAIVDNRYFSYTQFIADIDDYIDDNGIKSNNIDNKFIRIDNANELYNFSKDVSFFANVYSGSEKLNHTQIVSVLSLNFVLGDDIDYTALALSPMYPIGYEVNLSSGTKRAAFTGTFDGQGFEIINLSLGGEGNLLYEENQTLLTTTKYLSLFPINEGTIKNFGLINPNIEFIGEHTDLNKAANIVGLNEVGAVVDHVYVIDDRATIGGSGIRMLSVEGGRSFYAAGLVFENKGVFSASYYVSKTVVFSNYSRYFQVQPLYYSNSGTVSNITFDNTYAISFLIGSYIYYVETPNTPGVSTANLKSNKSNVISNVGWFVYKDDRYPALFGITGSKITKAVELVALSKVISLEKFNSKLNYEITQDLYMNQVAASAYKTPTRLFDGSLKGSNNENKTIHNLIINGRASINNEYHSGLFGVSNGAISYLTFANAELTIIDSDTNPSTISNYGILSGSRTGTQAITSVYVNGEISLGNKNIGETNVGMIVGKSSGPLEASYAEGTIDGGNHQFDGQTSLTAKYNMGGLVGRNNTALLTVSNSSTKVEINGIGTANQMTNTTSVQIAIGGIIGYINGGLSINDMTFDGEISLREFKNNNTVQNVGGLVGLFEGSTNVSYKGQTVGTSATTMNSLGHLDLRNTGQNTIHAAGGIVNNSTGTLSFQRIINKTTFERDNYSNFRYTGILLNKSTSNVGLSNCFNYADVNWKGHSYSGIYDNINNPTNGVTFSRIDNFGDITLENRTFTEEVKVSGFTNAENVAISRSTYQGDIRISNIETDYPIWVAGFKTRSLVTTEQIASSTTYGNIIVAGINTSANIYLAGFANLHGTGSDVGAPGGTFIRDFNSINGLNITSYYSEEINGITGSGNVYAGGFATFSANSVGFFINSGNILLVNKSPQDTSSFIVGDNSGLLYNKFIPDASNNPTITQGVVAGGIVAAAINNSFAVNVGTNDADVIAISNNYARAAGIVAIAGEAEIRAGSTVASYFSSINNANTAVIRSVLNYGNIVALGGKIGDYSAGNKPPVFASAGGMLAYGSLHINNGGGGGAVNHGLVASTDVAGGIVGTVSNSQTATNDSTTMYFGLINYGDVRAIKNVVRVNLFDTITGFSDLIEADFYDYDDSFITGGADLSLKRGIGAIFGRMQYKNTQYLNSTGTNDLRFKIIINMNENVDFIGFIDNPYVNSSNEGNLRARVDFIGYSAKANDTTPEFKNKGDLSVDVKDRLSDYEFRIFNNNNVSSRSFRYIRFVPNEVLNDRFKNNPRYGEGMYIIGDHYTGGLEQGYGASFLGFYLNYDNSNFGDDYDKSPERIVIANEIKARIQHQMQVSYQPQAYVRYGINFSFTDAYNIEQIVKEITYDNGIYSDALTHKFLLDLSLNFVDKDAEETSYSLTARNNSDSTFANYTLVARRFEDTDFFATNDKEGYRQALINEYEVHTFGGHLVTGDYAPKLTLDLTQFEDLATQTTVPLGYFVVYSQAAIFDANLFGDSRFQTTYEVDVAVTPRLNVVTPILTSYIVDNTVPTNVAYENHDNYFLPNHLTSSVELFLEDPYQVFPIGFKIGSDTLNLEYYNEPDDEFIVVEQKTANYLFSSIAAVEDPVTNVRKFSFKITLQSVLTSGDYRIVYKVHGAGDDRYFTFDFSNNNLSSENRFYHFNVKNENSTTVDHVSNTITTYINFNRIIDFNFVEDSLIEGEIEKGETVTPTAHPYIAGQIYSYAFTQTGYLKALTFQNYNPNVQIVSIVLLSQTSDPITKARTYTIEYTNRAPNGDIRIYTHTIYEQALHLDSFYLNNAPQVEFEGKEFEIDLEQNTLKFALSLNASSSTDGYHPFYTLIPDENGKSYLQVIINGFLYDNPVANNGTSITIDEYKNLIVNFNYENLIGKNYDVTINFIRHDGEAIHIVNFHVAKILSRNAYLSRIRFSLNTDDSSLFDVFESDNEGTINENSTYNMQIHPIDGFRYDNSQNTIFNYRVMGIVSRIPLDDYAPVIVDYLPVGATVSRLYYDELGQAHWTTPINAHAAVSEINSLRANYTVDQITGQELVDEDAIVTYKVMSEERDPLLAVDVYYHVTVMDVDFNVNFSFNIYHRTGQEGSFVDTPINVSILKDKVIKLTIVNFNTDVPISDAIKATVAEFPVFEQITSFNYKTNQFLIGIDDNYDQRISRNINGFYSFSIDLNNKNKDIKYGYDITFSGDKLNDIEDINVNGKYYYINSSTRQRARTFNIYIYEADLLDDSWGLTDGYSSMNVK